MIRYDTIRCDKISHSLNEIPFEDVPQWDPRQEPLQRLQGAVEQGRPLATVQDVLAQLVDLGEFLGSIGEGER